MGLFSAQPAVRKLPTFRLPLRIHSEFSLLPSAAARLRAAGPRLRHLLGGALNDARVVGGLLVVAIACLVLATAETVR